MTVLVIVLLSRRGSGRLRVRDRLRGRTGAGQSCQRPADSALQVASGDPVVAERFDVILSCFDLFLLRAEQFQGAEVHPIVEELRVLRRALAQGKKGLLIALDPRAGLD